MIERDPVLFAWRTAPRRHAAAAGLVLFAGLPLALVVLLSLRDLLDLPLQEAGGLRGFLALTLSIPDGAGVHPLPVSEGFPLDRDSLTLAALLVLSGSALLLSGLGWIVGRLCFGARSQAGQRLQAAATDAILRSPPGGRDELRTLPLQVGQALTTLAPLTAGSIAVPAMTLAACLLALLCAALSTFRLLPAVAVGLFAFGLAALLTMRRGRDSRSAKSREHQSIQSGLRDLIARMPAVRTHGAAPFEKRRLGFSARAERGRVAGTERRLAYALAPPLALATLVPAIVVATALWRGEAELRAVETLDPGALVATMGACALAATLIAASLRLWIARREAIPLLQDVSRTIEALSGRNPAAPNGSVFPDAGPLSALGAAGYDPVSGERVVGVDLDLAMPGHVAIVGERGSGAMALAALLSGQIEPSAGSVSYGGFPLRSLDVTERAHRFAYAGSEAILIEGTLRQNLLYGARTDDREALDTAKRITVVKLVGLDRLVYARGLDGHVDPQADPALAASIVRARRAVRAALSAQGLAHLVEPFDPDAYSHQASVGENILFGEARAASFSQARLASHPYLRAVLEAEELMQAFLEIGLSIARATVEIFADLPDDHPLLASFSLFPPHERGYFEDLIARQPEARGWRRGLAGQRDRERLIGLALRYNETRHRFGLVDEAFEARIVDARRTFRDLLPAPFRDKVEFYDPDRLTASASFEENVLFGRIAQGEAAAEERVRAVMRSVLAEQGLEPTVYRLGLASRVETETGAGSTGRRAGASVIGPRERMAIELARCLVRRPDLLVVTLPVVLREGERAGELIAKLRSVCEGRGLIVCLPSVEMLDEAAPFDTVLKVERSAVLRTAACPAPAARALDAVGA